MKKLNNKGMTIIEILVCFIIVSIISASIYSTVSNYNDKKNLESNKQEIYKFKNLLTKEIYDDIVYKGLINVSTYRKSTVFAGSPRDIVPSCTGSYYSPTTLNCTNNSGDMIIDSGGHGGTRLALIEFRYRDNSSKVLQIAVLKNTKNESGYGSFNDQYYVSYGPVVSGTPQLTHYPLPNLGTTTETVGGAARTLSDLSLEINDLTVTSANIFKMDLRFHHPDLEDKYGIKINVPINMDYYDR